MRLLPSIRRNQDLGAGFFRNWDDFDAEVARFFDLPALKETRWLPALEITETAESLVVKAEVPGLEKDEIEVSIQGDTLTLKGEKKEENAEKEGKVLRTERLYGSFFRSLILPAAVDPAAVKAVYKNGVLELTLPKKEEARPRQIQIDVK